jgi:quinol---cytochrome-c reductase cytochrome b subunit
LRLMPNLELHLFGHTLVPNPFFGGVLFPGIIFALLYFLPWLDRRYISRDHRRHDLLERPRDNPRRTALATGVFSAVVVVFAAGSADRLFFQFGFGYEGAIWFFRVLFFAVPVIAYLLTRRTCLALSRVDAHPLRDWDGQIVERNRAGGFEVVPTAAQDSSVHKKHAPDEVTDS